MGALSLQSPHAVRLNVVTRDVRWLRPVRRALGALYLAEEHVTLNGRTASAWGDGATGAVLAQGTGAAQPTVIPWAAGARTALQFDGSNDAIGRAITTGLNPSARGMSIVFVAQGTGASGLTLPMIVGARGWAASKETGYAICANGTSVSGKLSAHFADGTNGFDHADAGASASRGLSTTQRELWCVVFDDANDRLRWYRNGTLDTEGAPSWPTAATETVSAFAIGGAPPASTRMPMNLYALAIHTEPLTAGEVQTYWARWGPLYGVTP